MKTEKQRLVEALRHMARTGDPRKLLIEHLGFDHPTREAIDRSKWSPEWEGIVTDARFAAERSGFLAAVLTVRQDTPVRTWRTIATRIIVDYQGLALVCIHSTGGLRWLWSSPSLEQRRTAAAIAEGVRHVSVELEEDGSAPRGFVTLLSDIDVAQLATSLDVLSAVSAAFDQYTTILQMDLGANTFEALRVLTEGLLTHSVNRLKRDIGTLERIRPEVFILLYRFLFVLYAEAREIFPLHHPVYFERYSLWWWRERVTLPWERTHTLKEVGGLATTTLWQRCRDLFHLVAGGSELQGHRPGDFSFRPYYGTIFDPELHQDLEEWEVPNEFMAEAVRLLTRNEEPGGGTFFVDYSSLEIRHLGSIYERLLEYRLALDDESRVVHVLDEQERKSTGSYFTPSSLIGRLVADTLDPILARIRSDVGPNDLEGFENAVYSIRICDPAMGSGHFLVGVLDYLARAVADYRHAATGGAGPLGELVEVKRTLVRQCLYGVDKNPLTVELAKMSLWLETLNSDRPLSFLDAHLKTGNSLVGSWFSALDDPQRSLLGEDLRDHLRAEVQELIAIERQEEMEAVDVKHKVHAYKRIRATNTRYGRLRRLLDSQIGSHFGATVEDWRSARSLLRSPRDFNEFTAKTAWRQVDEISRRIAFFHWELEFPELFYTENGERKDDAGFDAVIGNPPWDRVRFAYKEFFRHIRPDIVKAPTAAAALKLIEKLRETDPVLWNEYNKAATETQALIDFFRSRGEYPFSTAGSHLNYYALFLERSVRTASKFGLIGMIAPTGVVTDYGNRDFARHIIDNGLIASLFDFENKGLFPDVDDRFRFCLVILVNHRREGKTRFAFGLHRLRELDAPGRLFEVSGDDIEIFNPNTRTVPTFLSDRDAHLNLKMYRAAGRVFLLENPPREIPGNPWGARAYQMFNMTSDSDKFHTRSELEGKGWRLSGDTFTDGKHVMGPLYEAKMVHHWNPRFATYHGASQEDLTTGLCRESTLRELKDPTWNPIPRYWVSTKNVEAFWEPVRWTKRWVVVFRDITNATNERTMISTFAPAAGFGNKAPALLTSFDARKVALLVANLSSIPLDYCARNKMIGTSMNFYILWQLPVFAPQAYEAWTVDGRPLSEYVLSAVAELACTSQSLRPLAEELGRGTLGKWVETRRFHLMREIDAIFAHLYGLTRDEFAYVLDTFPILRENDIRKFGEFRTKSEALRIFDNLKDRLSKGGSDSANVAEGHR